MYTTFWHLVGWTLVRPIGSRIDLIIRPMNQWDGIVAHSSSTSGTRVRWEEFDEKRAVLLEIEEREGKFSYISWMVLSYEFDPRYISMGNGKFWKVSWRETLLNIMYRDRKIEKLEKIKYRLREIFCRFCRELKNLINDCIGENGMRKISKSIHLDSICISINNLLKYRMMNFDIYLYSKREKISLIL